MICYLVKLFIQTNSKPEKINCPDDVNDDDIVTRIVRIEGEGVTPLYQTNTNHGGSSASLSASFARHTETPTPPPPSFQHEEDGDGDFVFIAE